MQVEAVASWLVLLSLDTGSSGLSSSPGWGTCAVVLSKVSKLQTTVYNRGWTLQQQPRFYHTCV